MKHHKEGGQEEKAEFWGILDDSIGIIPEENLLTIGGDLNGHVGKDRNGFEEIVGGLWIWRQK